MDSPSWRALVERALDRHRDVPEARFVQLATVTPEGRPANRTLVFRGFFEPGDQLQFATDARSAKVAQLGRTPWAEACWYFPLTREQFRVSGRVRLIGARSRNLTHRRAREALWLNLTEQGRQNLTWPPPGQPRADHGSFHDEPPNADQPSSAFALLLLEPEEVDHLELDGDPQKRTRFHRVSAARWSAVEINP